MNLSDERDSNPQPSAWEADALPLSYHRIARLSEPSVFSGNSPEKITP